MQKVGTIKEIWRYPVKGMAGERLERCSLGTMGLNGDRTWALRDNARKEIQSCKFRPELLLCSARCRSGDATGSGEQVDVSFPDGSLLGSDNAEIHAMLSMLTGHASTLEPLRPDTELDFYRRHKLDDHTWLDELKEVSKSEKRFRKLFISSITPLVGKTNSEIIVLAIRGLMDDRPPAITLKKRLGILISHFS